MEKICELTKRLKDAYKRKELYWCQKARINWLKEGDNNTKFFHASVEGRRKRNKISILEKNDGSWCSSKGEIEKEIDKYFR